MIIDFSWLIQDHLAKFLTSKRASEVAMQILDIFLLFGAPSILQSDNGAEFTTNIIGELKNVWPECKIVQPRHSQSQGSVERANTDVKDMTITWMRENHTKDSINELMLTLFFILVVRLLKQINTFQ
jgi:hypothetical protein